MTRPYLLLFYLTLAFTLFTAIGTLSHELGHYAVAKYYGHRTHLHYASLTHRPTADWMHLEDYMRQDLYVRLGGPVQTMLTGMLGILMLLYRRKRHRSKELRLLDWTAVFLALFWLRQAFNPAHSLVSELLYPNGKLFGGDEARISMQLGWPHWVVPVVLGVWGLAVGLWVVFRVIPGHVRPYFILSGFLGAALGWFVWMDWIGPLLLP